MNYKSLTVEKFRKLDQTAIVKIGIPSLALMENAGRQCAEHVLKHCRRTCKQRVLIVCGFGNNAGDGFVIARYLQHWGLKPKVMVMAPAASLKNDAAVNFKAVKNLKIPILKPAQLKRALIQTDVIVDALFGVGLNREITSPISEVIDQINASKLYTVAVDIPSGLNGNNGTIYGCCVKANVTLTFSCLKRGMLKDSAKRYTGPIKVFDIGIPKALLKDF